MVSSIHGIYQFTLKLASSRYAIWILAAVSFAESSVFPIPPDVLLIPMVLAAPQRTWLIASVCLASSVLGGIAGYFIGAVLYDQLGQPVLAYLGQADHFAEFTQIYNRYGAWAVLVAGFTPFPYKVITILSGATGLSFPVFVVSSIVARGARFFLVSWLLWRFGETIRSFIEKRLGVLSILLVVVLFGAYLLLEVL